MAKYRKKPIVIEAVQWLGNNVSEMEDFFRGPVPARDFGNTLLIQTLEGNLTTQVGDWIIKGVQGEFYPCKPDIFEKTYEKVEE